MKFTNKQMAEESMVRIEHLQPVSIEALTRAMQEISLLPKPDQWIVVDPQGRMYQGTVEQMTGLLVQEHPLMRTHFELSGRYDG